MVMGHLCVLESRHGCSLGCPRISRRARRPLPAWEFRDYLGWMEQGDGRLAYGVFVQNGRLKGELKQALRTVIERYELPVRITANQNLILAEIEPSWKADILHILGQAGVR